MGSLFGGNKVTQATDPIAQDAFNMYKDALGGIKGGLSNHFNQVMKNPVYGGQTYAGLDPFQQQFYNQAGSFGNQAFGNAGNMMSGNMNNFGATSGYGQEISDFQQGLKDPNAGFNYAQNFANSPLTQGLIDAAGADVKQQLGMDINNLNMGSIGGSNLNSSRTGAMEGVFRGQAAKNLMDTSANIRQNAFNTGLGQFNQNIGQQAGALGQLAGANQQAAGGVMDAFNMGQGANQMIGSAGDFMRNFNQGALDDAEAQFYQQQDRPFNLMQQYMSMFNPLQGFSGGAGYAGSGQQQGGLDKAGQLMNIIGTGMTLFCWVAREVYGEQNFKWRMFRHYMFFDAPRWLHNLYAKYGERFALFIANKPRIKSALRYFMDKAIRKYGGPHGAI